MFIKTFLMGLVLMASAGAVGALELNICLGACASGEKQVFQALAVKGLTFHLNWCGRRFRLAPAALL